MIKVKTSEGVKNAVVVARHVTAECDAERFVGRAVAFNDFGKVASVLFIAFANFFFLISHVITTLSENFTFL